MTNITSVTVFFGHGIKREEYGPTKKAEVSITASVAENEDGTVVLDKIGAMALAKVADLLIAPKPDTATEQIPSTAQAGPVAAGEPPARRTRGPNKPKEIIESGAAPAAGSPASSEADAGSSASAAPADMTTTEDDWSAGASDIEVTDQEILSATSKRAGELGARDPIVKLIATFATRTEGAPFKVQEIPQAQRKDYLSKLAALTA